MKKTLTGLLVLCCSIGFGQNFHIDKSKIEGVRLISIDPAYDNKESGLFHGTLDSAGYVGKGPVIIFSDPASKLKDALAGLGSNKIAFKYWAHVGYDTLMQKWIAIDCYYEK